MRTIQTFTQWTEELRSILQKNWRVCLDDFVPPTRTLDNWLWGRYTGEAYRRRNELEPIQSKKTNGTKRSPSVDDIAREIAKDCGVI